MEWPASFSRVARFTVCCNLSTGRIDGLEEGGQLTKDDGRHGDVRHLPNADPTSMGLRR